MPLIDELDKLELAIQEEERRDRRKTLYVLGTVALLLLGLATMAHCGTFTLSGTFPVHTNRGTCSAPELLDIYDSQPMTLHWTWRGPVTGASAYEGASGHLFTVDTPVPQGLYTIKVWFESAGGQSCDTTITHRVAPPYLHDVRMR